MVDFTFEEYADMHLIYGEARCNTREAERLYAERFPNRRHPSRNTFAAVHRRLRETGSFKPSGGTGHPRTARTVAFEEEVLERIAEQPSTSTRAIANEMNAAHQTVWRVLHEQLLHPYHLQKVQALGPLDYQPRVDFCLWFLQRIAIQPDFGSIILFTDEACFTRDGYFNSRNSHIWDDDNPHAAWVRAHQQQFAINMWAGIVADFLIGPYLLPPRLTGNIYLHFLQDVLPELLDNAHVPIGIRARMWFQHDGAPAHFSRIVQDHLNQQFPARWIGRGGAIRWPARSPDLTPLDFFLWGYMKSLVYETPVNTQEELLGRVMAASLHIQQDPHIFQRVRDSMSRRINLCNQVGGRHFETLL